MINRAPPFNAQPKTQVTPAFYRDFQDSPRAPPWDTPGYPELTPGSFNTQDYPGLIPGSLDTRTILGSALISQATWASSRPKLG